MKTAATTKSQITENQWLETAIADLVNVTDFVKAVEMEVDMGFLSNPFFDAASGCGSNGCQRISYCSCDCNHCSVLW